MGKGVLIHALFGKNSFGSLLMSNYTGKPEKQHFKDFFPEKEICDVAPDPRPKKKNSVYQVKNQDLRGKRFYTQNCIFTEWCCTP